MNDKVIALQKLLQEVIESTRNETKSSAGDKYETGRAMLQIEQDNIRQQLKESLHQKAAFEKIEPELKTSAVARGSLVKTDKGYFFVGIPLPKIIVDGITVFLVSTQSPLGSRLLGLKTSESVVVNGRRYIIESIH